MTHKALFFLSATHPGWRDANLPEHRRYREVRAEGEGQSVASAVRQGVQAVPCSVEGWLGHAGCIQEVEV